MGPGIDLVIPTMWRAGTLIDSLVAYAKSDQIASIILIDNDSGRRPALPQEVLAKLQMIEHGRNIYVNQAWNEGVSLCKSELICIVNDDIQIDPMLFQALAELDPEAKGIELIGLDLHTRSSETFFRKILVDRSRSLGTQYPTFGAMMIMPRSKYRPIPEALKVWYGDDYLVHQHQEIYLLSTPLVTGAMSTTIRDLAATTEIEALVRQDIEWAKRHLLHGAGSGEQPLLNLAPVELAAAQPIRTSVDLGCGSRPQNPFSAERLIGIDAQVSAEGVVACWVGFEPIPLADSSVDFVTAFDFIEHIPRFALRDKPFNPFIDAMSEIWRILKPNGVFLARTPAYPSAAAFQDPTHVNIITDQTVSYFAQRPCLDGSLIDPWGPPLGKLYGFKGEFQLVKQWWDTTHLCWHLQAIK